MAKFNLDDKSKGSTVLIDDAARIDSGVNISLTGQNHRVVIGGEHYCGQYG